MPHTQCVPLRQPHYGDILSTHLAPFAAPAESSMAQNLFRKESLEKLASPEQLDQLVRVTGPLGWAALLGLLAAVAAGVVWSMLGEVRTTAAGSGILSVPATSTPVNASGAGTVTQVYVKAGDRVEKGQVLADVSQGETRTKLANARRELAEDVRMDAVLREVEKSTQELEVSTADQQRTSLTNLISTSQERLGEYQRMLSKQRELLAKNIIGETSLLQTEQSVDSIRKSINDAQSQLKQLETQLAKSKQQTTTDQLNRKFKIDSQRRSVADLESNLERTSEVRSPTVGRVALVQVERQATVANGSPMFLIVPAVDPTAGLVGQVYFPAADAKRVRAGMPVEVVPATVKREEFGFLIGKVLDVSEVPATEASAEAEVYNKDLVSDLTKKFGVMFSARVELRPDPATPSGYSWSSSVGPPHRIAAGTPVTVSAVVERHAPITLVVPYLKKQLGLD